MIYTIYVLTEPYYAVFRAYAFVSFNIYEFIPGLTWKGNWLRFSTKTESV